MEKVGVEAVVAGLSAFLGDMKKVDSSIQGLIPGTKLLENAFAFLGDTVSGFVNFALNTLAHALGELVADAVEFVIQKLGELVEATIEAGAEFQTLELRLSTLNFNSATESGLDYNAATAESIRLTKEQLDWIQKLAVLTPYDAQDIANVYTLARSYGFVDEEAKTLTESISNFAAGMGLGSQEIERIIVNFGQMVQQGKVTQREMNDLARGSFVPVNDVLKLMSQNTGVAMDAMDDFRKTGESVPAFMEAFIQLVDQRFSGASEKMASTFQGATANLKDLIKSIGGMNIVKPVLDVIGRNISKFITALTDEKRWDEMVMAAKGVGNGIASIVSSLLSLMPSADGVADGVVNALNGISGWLNKNKLKISTFILSIKKWIDSKLIPAIQELVKWLFGEDDKKGAFQRFGEWLETTFVPAVQSAAKWVGDVLVPFLKNDLLPVFIALLPLAGAIGQVLITAFGGTPNQSFTDWIHNTLIPGIQAFTEWILTNKDEIALWVERLLMATIQIAIFMAILSGVIAIISNVVAAFFNWLAVSNPWVAAILAAVAALGLLYVALTGPLGILLMIGAVIGFVILQFKLLKLAFDIGVGAFEILFKKLGELLEELKQNVIQTFTEIGEAALSGDWEGVGKAIIDGMARGITANWNFLIDLVKSLAQNMIDTFKESFNIDFDITDALGIGQGNSPRSQGSTLAPRTVNSSTTSNYHYNLSINSSANTEPVIADFNMLSSIGGR